MSDARLVAIEQVQRAIVLPRGQPVVLDEDLGALYGVQTRVLVQAVKPNAAHFPADFVFQVTAREERL